MRKRSQFPPNLMSTSVTVSEKNACGRQTEGQTDRKPIFIKFHFTQNLKNAPEGNDMPETKKSSPKLIPILTNFSNLTFQTA